MTPDRHDLSLTLPWMAEGTELFLTCLAQLSDADLDGSAALPGWTRRHVVGHLARNAEALDHLLDWAQTGVPTPMYSSPGQRNDDIESSRLLPAEQLRREVAATAAGLQAHAEALGPEQWAAVVRSAKGRDIPAREVPWMRSREVWLHALDLGTGVAVGVLPEGFCEVLIADVLGTFGAAETAPALQLVSTSSSGEWHCGPAETAQVVSGPSIELAAWVSGRSAGAGLTSSDPLPALPQWL